MRVLPITKRFLSKYSNIQLFVIIIIIVSGFFLGDSSIFKRIYYTKKIIDLKSQINQYNKDIKNNKEKLLEIETDNEHIEKYAREKYFMKKPNEDVFVIQ